MVQVMTLARFEMPANSINTKDHCQSWLFTPNTISAEKSSEKMSVFLISWHGSC